MIQGCEEITESAVAVYQKARDAQPENPKVLRNYAVLCHRLAIALEEAAKTRDAERHCVDFPPSP